ncbi:MAG: pilus assembly protein PilM, partial [Fibrobacterota bacterium]
MAGIKVVELEERHGRPVLLTYGFCNRPVGEYKQKLIDDPAGSGALLKKICAKAGTISKKCITGLPISSVFSALVNVPAGDEKEMKPAIELQAAKLSPWPIADIILDWRVISVEKTDGVKGAQALVTGAQKNLIKQYVEIFKAAGLEIMSLETEAFALMRSLI